MIYTLFRMVRQVRRTEAFIELAADDIRCLKSDSDYVDVLKIIIL